jgi:general stress protein YciG
MTMQEDTSSKTQSDNNEGALAPDPLPASAQGAPARRPRGFAAMDRDLVRSIARKGGRAAHDAGTAHEFTSTEAREAGRKGGHASQVKRRERDAQPPTAK